MNATAPRLPLRAQWINAAASRQLALAEQLAPQVLARNPRDELVRRCNAHLLELQGRSAEALVHWQALHAEDGSDFEAACHIVRGQMASAGQSAEAAAHAALPASCAAFRAAVVAALAEPLPMLEGDFRHVAICGVSYCGSTVVDRMLGGLPGVRSIGESHWLVKAHFDGAYRNARMSDPIEDIRFVPCTVCGKTCEVLTRSFRRSLAGDGSHWYRKIAHRLGTRTLISADKNLVKFIEKDPFLEMSALIIFKSPVQAWASTIEKLAQDRDAEFYAAECARYMGIWARTYRMFLDHFRPAGKLVFLNFDAFAQRPEPLLRKVCAALDLPFDPGVLMRTVPGHAVGGNGRAMRRLRDADYGVDITPLPDPTLPPAHIDIIEADGEAQAVWREMIAFHRALEQG